MVNRRVKVGDFVILNKDLYDKHYKAFIYKTLELSHVEKRMHWFKIIPVKLLWLYEDVENIALILPESHLVNLGTVKERPILKLLYKI